MFTGRIRIRVPGIFAPSASDTPSLGCSVRISWLGRTPTEPSCWKAEVRDGLERDRDLGDLARQPLAGAQVERHAGPAPVVDLAAAAPRRSPCWSPRARPPPRGSRGRPRRRPCPRRTGPRTAMPVDRRRASAARIACRTLTFSSRTSSAVKCDRRLHRDVAQQLEHVVLDEVAQRAGAVVVAGARADADVLGRGDLDVGRCSCGSTPARTARWRTGTPSCSGRSPCPGSGRCGRPGRSCEDRQHARLSSSASASVVPNGFSMMHRTSASSRRSSPVLAELPRRSPGRTSGAVER